MGLRSSYGQPYVFDESGASRRLVLTVSIGEAYQQISALTHPLMADYAHRCGASFEVITERVYPSNVQMFWEKLQMRDYLQEYGRIAFIDSDVIIHPQAPSLFDVVPEGYLGMLNEAAIQSTKNKRKELEDFCQRAGIQMPKWDGNYVNVGVIVFGRQHLHVFDDPPKWVRHDYPEQAWVNIQIARLKPKMFFLPRSMHDWKHVADKKSWLIHYAGHRKDEKLAETIKKDIANGMV